MNRYNAHPIDLYRYALPLILAGSLLIALGWFWTGLSLGALGFVIVGWIGLAGYIDQITLYLDRLVETAAELDKTRQPEVWIAMNIRVAPKAEPRWMDQAPEQPNLPAPTNIELFDPSWLTATKLTQFVDGALMGKSLGETTWAGKDKPLSSNEIRRLKDQLRKFKLIRQVNETNKLLGDALTAKGRRELLPYASPGIREVLQPRVNSYMPDGRGLSEGGSPPLLN